MSTVFRGTTFENRCLRILESTFRGMALRRVGGKDDGGIDILGWWDLPCTRRLRILAQCKAEKKKSSPRYIREMEGVAMVYRAGLSTPPIDADHEERPTPGDIVAFLLSESPFTKATLVRAIKSPVPLMLLHVPPLAPPLLPQDVLPDVQPIAEEAVTPVDVDGGASVNDCVGALAGVVWNPAMQALLPNSELRVEMGASEGNRFGIWQGSTRL